MALCSVLHSVEFILSCSVILSLIVLFLTAKGFRCGCDMCLIKSCWREFRVCHDICGCKKTEVLWDISAQSQLKNRGWLVKNSSEFMIWRNVIITEGSDRSCMQRKTCYCCSLLASDCGPDKFYYTLSVFDDLLAGYRLKPSANKRTVHAFACCCLSLYDIDAGLSQRISESPRQQRLNLYFGRASIVVSLTGIALGAVALTVGLSLARGMSASNYLNSQSTSRVPSYDAFMNQTTTKPPGDAIATPPCYRINSACFFYVSTYGPLECSEVNGVMGYDAEIQRSVCYHNTCEDYSVEGKCFKYRLVMS